MVVIRKKNIILIVILLVAVSYFVSPARNDEALQLYTIGSRKLYEAVETGSFNDITESIKILQRSYENNSNFFNAVRDLARAYYLIGDFVNALIYTNKAMVLRQDFKLEVLEANILVHQNKLDEAGSLILVLLEKNSYDKDLLFTATLYFSAIGDFINYNRIVETYKRLYNYTQEQEKLYIYTVLKAINNREQSSVAQKAAKELAFSQPNNVWIIWLLLEYFLLTPESEINLSEADIQQYVEKLQNSEVPFLVKIAYSIILRTQVQTSENTQQILNFAREYTKRFPYSADAWFQRGLILHSLEMYKESLGAFSRAKEAQPHNTFFSFVFDNTLKKIRDKTYKKQINKRVTELVTQGRDFLDAGNITESKRYARRALYVDPLSTSARVLLSDVFSQQGFLLRTSTELDLLLKQDDPPADIPAILESINAVTDSVLEGFPRVSSETISVIPWRISVTVDTNESLQQEEKNFLQDLVTYSLSNYSKMRITNLMGDTDIALLTKKLRINIIFAQNDIRFAARAVLREESTDEIITIISESRSGNNREIDTVDALSQKVNLLLPTILNVLSEQKSNSLLIGGGTLYSIDTGDTFPLFNTGNISVISDIPHFKSASNQIGYLEITNVFSSYSIGVPATQDSTQTNENIDNPVFNKYEMLSEINSGDIIIIEPEQWTDDRNDSNTMEFLTTRDSRVAYLLKNMLLPLW